VKFPLLNNMTKQLKELPGKYEFMYLDFIQNYTSVDYFALMYGIRVKKAIHILNVGKMVLCEEYQKN